MSHIPRRRRPCTGPRTGFRTWGSGAGSDLSRPGGATRPSPSRPRRHPDPRQPCTFVEHPPQADPVIDAIASQLTGEKINAGIVLIDGDWAAGKSLETTLADLTRIARAASRQYTAGLWTLIAWINWRTNNRPAAWDALDLALDIDPDEDPAHYLAVFMHERVDPRRIRPIHWR